MNRSVTCTLPIAALRVQLSVGVWLQEKPAGPHVLANLQVLFTRERFAQMICYLTFAAPKTFSTLIHEMTADLVRLLPCISWT